MKTHKNKYKKIHFKIIIKHDKQFTKTNKYIIKSI